ncbi:MAG TPA: hypothetical protein VFN53_02055 [Acidobacteriaceae bacterium]|nr:hypothetical protein [Acidobacteriaceae bacterium]
MSDPLPAPNLPQPNGYGPLTARQLYERTFALLREDFKLFFGIVLVVIGVEIVVGVVLGLGGVWTRHTGAAGPIAKVLFLLPIGLVGGALIYLFTQIIQGALFFATRSKLIGPPLSVGEACQMAAARLGRIVGISALVALRMLGYMVLFYLGMAMVLVIAVASLGGATHFAGQLQQYAASPVPAGLYILAVLCGLVFLLVYLTFLFWLVARYALSVAACLAEDLTVTNAIRRSLRLSARSRGRIYAVLAGAFCLWIAVTLLTLPVQLMGAAMGAHAHHISHGAEFLGLLLAAFRMVVSGIVIAFMGVATTLCYYDLRVRKEGFGAASGWNENGAGPVIAPDTSPLLNPDVTL